MADFIAGGALAPNYVRFDALPLPRVDACTWTLVLTDSGGEPSFRKVFCLRRVGMFTNGHGAVELALGEGEYLGLEIDADVPEPALQREAHEEAARSYELPDYYRDMPGQWGWRPPAGGSVPVASLPDTWYPNVIRAWAGARGQRPSQVLVAPRGTATPATGTKPVWREFWARSSRNQSAGSGERPALDWSGLTDPLFPYANDPMVEVIPRPAMHQERVSCAAVALADGKVLVAGGWIPNTAPVSGSEIFDPKLERFVNPAATLAAHAFHALAPLPDGRVLLIPGWPAKEAAATPEVYDPVRNMWSAGPLLPRAFYWPGAIALDDGRVLVLDWRHATEPDSTLVFDPVAWAWSAPAPKPPETDQESLTKLPDGRILVLGGDVPFMNFDGDPRAYAFDPRANRWESLAPPRIWRGAHTSTVLRDGRVLIAGGSFCRCCEIYDPVANRWTFAASMSHHRAGHAAALLADGRVLVAGGSGTDASRHLPAGEIYDPAGDTWVAAARGAEVGGTATAVTLPDGSALLLGGITMRSSDQVSEGPGPLAATETLVGDRPAGTRRFRLR